MERTPLALPFSAKRLRELRERAGLLQEDLAELTARGGKRVGRSSIAHLESGNRSPRPPTLKALASALGVEVDDLLERAS